MDEVQYVSSKLLSDLEIKHGWFMRFGGVSEELFESLNGKKGAGDSDYNVDQNRKRALSAVIPAEAGIQTKEIVHIIHEFKTSILMAEKAGEFAGFDALFTSDSGLVLSQTTADCASVIIADTNKKVVALIHGSWHTLKGQIISKTINRLNEIDGVGELVAGIGPMICKNCYEFGLEAKELFDSKYLTPANQKYLVDIKQMVTDQLKQSGIIQIDDVNICTKEDERFFSHRRSGANSGRMITLASLTDVV